MTLTLAALVIAVAAAQESSVALAISDGRTLVPIAHFTGTTWVDACDAGRGSGARPLTFSTRSGELATSGGVSIEAVQRVPADSPEWQSVLPAVSRVFQQRARGERISSSTTESIPMTLDWLYATSAGGSSRLYYFEASKLVPDQGGAPDTDPTGTVRVTVAGWLRTIGDHFDVVGSRSELRWEQDDRTRTPPAPDLAPLGVLRHDGRIFWVARTQIGNRRRFSIFEALPSRMVTLLAGEIRSC